MIESSSIAGTLKYGETRYEKFKRIFKTYTVVAVIIAVLGFMIGAFLGLKIIKNDLSSVECGLIMIFGSLPFLASFVFVILTYKEFMKSFEEIGLWIDDAIETDGYVEKVDGKIKVSFKIEEETHVCESADNAAQHFWKKYLNKNVRIAYSPEYDQVMILKTLKAQKK